MKCNRSAGRLEFLRLDVFLGLMLLLALGLSAGMAQEADDDDLPEDPFALEDEPFEGPSWGRTGRDGTFKPTKANPVFATADGCGLCHEASDTADAFRNATGDDVSPNGLWQATMMANAFRDPYFRAQVSAEVASAPESERGDIEATCITCHAPMAHHTARMSKSQPVTIAQAEQDPLARDGVSCTVCHQAWPGPFGTPEGINGNLEITMARVIFGRRNDPFVRPMIFHSAFTPQAGDHLADSGLCGTCHTLKSKHGDQEFLEQASFLEWRASQYGDEDSESYQSCRDCHMASIGSTRLARNPRGFDYLIRPREDVRAHAFVGGNAYMLDMFAKHGEELGMEASPEAFRRMARATRQQLGQRSAHVTIEDFSYKDLTVAFKVKVENLTGHKFPTGYPARRAWISVMVRDGATRLVTSGNPDDNGRIEGISGPMSLPHYDKVTDPSQVVIYQSLPVDEAGKVTTGVTKMRSFKKDNRLLPKGWRGESPDGIATKPVGTDGDENFVPGFDTVQYEFKVPPSAVPRLLRLDVVMFYQPVPPGWVEPLRKVDTEEARLFMKLYDQNPPKPIIVSRAGFQFQERRSNF